MDKYIGTGFYFTIFQTFSKLYTPPHPLSPVQCCLLFAIVRNIVLGEEGVCFTIEPAQFQIFCPWLSAVKGEKNLGSFRMTEVWSLIFWSYFE